MFLLFLFIKLYLDMVQEIIVGVIFLAALVYISKIIYRSFKPKNGVCGKGCGSCGAVDFKKLEKQIKKDREKQYA